MQRDFGRHFVQKNGCYEAINTVSNTHYILATIGLKSSCNIFLFPCTWSAKQIVLRCNESSKRRRELNVGFKTGGSYLGTQWGGGGLIRFQTVEKETVKF